MASPARKISDQTATSVVAGSATALDVAIRNAAGTHVDPSIAGGGQQYTEGDTDSTITGQAMLGEAAGNTLMPLQIDGSGNLLVAVTGAGSGGTSSVDDADFTAGTTAGTLAMGVYESTPTSITDGDVGVLGATAKRALKVTLYSEAGAAVTGGDASAANQATMIASLSVMDDWDESDRLKANIIVGQPGIAAGTGVDGVTVPRVTLATNVALPAGTNAIGKLAANSGVDIGDVDITSIAAGDNNIGNVDIVTMPGVVGTIADDATTPGNPVMIGGKAVETDGTDPTAVSAEDDVAILRTDRNRRLLVNDVHPRLWSVSADYGSAQTNASVKAAPGASLSLYITDISISNGAVAGNITLLDGSGGAVVLEIYPAINGGAVLSLKTPIRLTANTALCITSTTVTTHSVFVSGYIAP